MYNYWDVSVIDLFNMLTVLYEIFKPDHNALTLMLPVNCSVQDIIDVLVDPGEDYVVVKMNSSGGMKCTARFLDQTLMYSLILHRRAL